MNAAKKKSEPEAAPPLEADLPPMEEAPEEPEELAVSEPEAAKAVEPSKSHSGRSLTPKEIPPFAWKLVGMSSGRLLTLVKSVEKEEVESHLLRLHREGFYTNLDILPIDPEIAAAKKAADHRPGAKTEPKTSEPKTAEPKAAEPKTPESKAGKAVVTEKSEHKLPPPKEGKGSAVARAATDGESEQKPATRPKKTDSKKAEKAPEERRSKEGAKKPEKKLAEASSNVTEETKKPKGEMGRKTKPAVARKTKGSTDKPRSASEEKGKTEKTKSEKSKPGKTKSVDKSKAKDTPKLRSPKK